MISLGALWIIASFSFVVALSGALVPGPLLTYTIVKTMQTQKRGFLVGAWVIAGHGLLESVLVVLLLLGFAVILKKPIALKIIGAVGGTFLIYMGLNLLINLISAKIPKVFNNANETQETPASGEQEIRLPGPIIGGIVVSMSNPYWWIWWATIGMAFVLQYDISFKNWPALLAFLIGHELGDLGWYWLVSILISLGRGRINEKVYKIVLAVCAVVMVGFGLYLGISPFFK